MPARLILAFRWIALAVIVLAIALIFIRRKIPPRTRVASQPASSYWKELWLRWMDAREYNRERAVNLAAIRGRRALIVDPDEKSARVLTWRLTKLRCATDRARTGALGLKVAQEQDPSFVVADALLPDMTAAEFYDALPSKDMPIVFVGVLPNQWDHIRSLGRNVACLSKPFDPDEVAELAGLAIRRLA